MTRIAHNRALLSLLLVLLQISFLPDPARLRCMLRAGSLACCCSHVVETGVSREVAPPAEQRGCCARLARPDEPATRFAGSDARDEAACGGDRTCTCGAGAHKAFAVEHTGDHPDHDTDVGLSNPFGSRVRDGRVASKRVELREIPRARTGPPLHVLYRVFLI
jgi:hypothetical protein